MNENSQKYDITKADIRTSDGRAAKIIPSREYWALVARAETVLDDSTKMFANIRRVSPDVFPVTMPKQISRNLETLIEIAEGLEKDGEADENGNI